MVDTTNNEFEAWLRKARRGGVVALRFLTKKMFLALLLLTLTGVTGFLAYKQAWVTIQEEAVLPPEVSGRTPSLRMSVVNRLTSEIVVRRQYVASSYRDVVRVFGQASPSVPQ